MEPLHVDFETRGTIDLPAVGIDIYSRHPDTDVWCMGYAFGNEEAGLLVPGYDGGWHSDQLSMVITHVIRGGIVMAHNAPFELAIWNNIMVPRYGWPVLKPEQVRCTMAMAYAMALPGALEKAAPAVGIAEQKDMKGSRLMMQMCRPKSTDNGIKWWDEPEKLEKLYAYCKQDVRVERELEKRLLQLSESEQALWVLDQEINNRGIYIDRPAVEAAIKVVEYEQKRLADEIRKVTGNAVSIPSEVAALTRWIAANGVEVSGIAKADVLDLLADESLPDPVRQALKIRQEYAKSSTAKLKKMLAMAGEDGRARNILQYHGAGTGRWAGRGIQLHNMPRPNLSQEEIEEILEFLPRLAPADTVRRIEMLYGPTMSVISSCLRGMLTAAPGHDLIAADFANIEGRVLAWLAGEEWKLQAFREYDAGTGPDLYILTYAKSFGLDHTTISKKDPRRQVGKVEELAFGYQGGVGAWRTMEKAYNPPKMTDAAVDDIKNRWREAHPRIKQYWYGLEGAAKAALKSPGLMISAGAKGCEVKFRVKGSFLFCRLPSCRVLTYPYARLDTAHTLQSDKDSKQIRTISERDVQRGLVPEGWRITRSSEDVIWYMTVDGTTSKWTETHTYGGKLAENVTQAVARDVLADSISRLDNFGFAAVLHVHDEVVVEVADDVGSNYQENVEDTMKETPAWASGLPIAVEGWRGKRYRK